MQHILFVLTAVIVFSTIFFAPNSATSTHPPFAIDGAVTQMGCEIIGGVLVSDTIDVNHTQTIELCQFGNKNYRISNASGCVAAVGGGWDPETGKHYSFPYICDVPQGCSMSSFWKGGASVFGHNTKLQISNYGKQFDVIVESKGTVCDLRFIEEEKKIGVVVNGVNNTQYFVNAAIPKELLSGEFKVLVDGEPAEFSIRDATELSIGDEEIHSVITFQFEFPESETGRIDIVGRKIEIIGTQVIPEFPVYTVLLLAAGISCTLVPRLLRGLLL